MKFSIQKSDIVNVLSKVQGLAGRRSNLAITECVRIQAKDGLFNITATDLETGFEGFYPAAVEADGKMAINARKFYEIVREFPTQKILIHEKENRWIEICDQKVQYHLMGMDTADFPDTPSIEDAVFVDVDSDQFKNMIEKSIIIGSSGEEKRAHISGILFESLTVEENPVFRMVSTDGSRLSTTDCSYAGKMESFPEKGILIPKKGLNEVAKFLDTGGQIQVGLQKSYFIVKKENETLIIRLLEGDFPQYKEVLKHDDVTPIHLDREELLNMMKRMSILSSDHYRAAIFTFESGKLLINATNPDIGESKEDLEIEFDREKIEAAFNPKFFIDTLNAIQDEKVAIHLASSDRPCIIEGTDDKSYMSVIMPMRI